MTLRSLTPACFTAQLGMLGLCPKPQQGTCSLHPFFASQRFKQGFWGKDGYIFREKPHRIPFRS